MTQVKLADLKPGDTVIVDGGFDCLDPGPHLVLEDEQGLYLLCFGPIDSAGKHLPELTNTHHYLDGQEDSESAFLVGITRLNLLPRYYDLLFAAHEAMKACDNFDLRSEDPASVSAWKQLRAVNRETQLALVSYVVARGVVLLVQLQQSEKNDLKEPSRD